MGRNKKNRFEFFIYKFFVLGYGKRIASGFYQGIGLGECGPTLNMNNKFGCFYQNYNLVQFINYYVNYNIGKHGEFSMKNNFI